MKILVVSHAGVLGVNRAIFQELALRERNFEVVIVVPERWKGDLIADLRFTPSPEDEGIRVIPLPVYFSGNGSLYFYARSVRKALGDWWPDFVFVDEEPWSLSALQIYWEFRNIPRTFFTKQNLKKRLPFPFEFLQRWIFAQSALAFSVASEVTEVLRWKGFGGRVVELPHSYDPRRFRTLSASERAEGRLRLGIPVDARVIGYFGRLTPEKGIADLLAVMNGPVPPIPGRRIYFWVGNGPEALTVLRSRASHPAGSIVYHEAIPHDEVGTTLALIDLLVLPSRTERNWKEQFGRILVEAWACGAAVLGSDSGEIPRLIRLTGGGHVFHERNPDDLAARLTEALAPGDLEEKSAAGNAYVRENLTHARVAERLALELAPFISTREPAPKPRESARDAARS